MGDQGGTSQAHDAKAMPRGPRTPASRLGCRETFEELHAAAVEVSEWPFWVVKAGGEVEQWGGAGRGHMGQEGGRGWGEIHQHCAERKYEAPVFLPPQPPPPRVPALSLSK